MKILKSCFVFFTRIPLSFTYITALLLIQNSFLLTSCTQGSTENPPILRIGNGNEPETIDPVLCQSIQCFRVTSALFEGLVGRGLDGGPIQPAIAHKWTISSDELTYTFHLRKSNWSDGNPVTAHDFVWSWHRLIDPKTTASYRNLLDAIDTSKLYASNDSTLIVTLKQPQAYFLDLLSLEPLFPTPRHIIEKYGVNWTTENPVSNGPFKLAHWYNHREIATVKNNFYWDHSHVLLDSLRFYPIDNNQTELSLFQGAQLDWIHKLAPTRIILWNKKPEFVSSAKYGIEMYRLNTTHPALKNQKIRLALSLAIDREKIVRFVTKGGEQALWSYFPEGIDWYPQHKWLEYNPKKAKQLLLESGLNPQQIGNIEIVYNQSGNNKVIAEVISQMWKTELGLQVSLRNVEWKVMLDQVDQLNYTVARSSWIGDYMDPTTFSDIFESTSPNNRTGYKSPTYDSLVKLVRSKTPNRIQILEKLDSLLSTDAPIMPLFSYRNIELRKQRIQGIHEHPLGLYNYKYIWLKK
jgi:oligopeptide transport system substrate-binding protein